MFKRTQAVRSQSGFTLIESCVALSTCAALLGQALPAFHQLRTQQALKAEALSVGEDLRWSHAQALIRGESVFLSFGSTQATQCYVVHTGAPGQCTCTADGASQCEDSAVALRVHRSPIASGIAYRSNAKTLNLQPRQGLVSSTATIEIRNSQGKAVRQIVAITGRVRSCSVGATMGGLPTCA